MKREAAAGGILRTRRIIIAFLLLGAVVLASVLAIHGCGRDGTRAEEAPGAAAAAQESATPVQVATAVRADIDQTIEVSGSIQTTDEVDVVAEVSGKVARVYADVGDYVRRGRTLVRVDAQVAAAQRDQAAAGVQSARAALNQAQEALRLTDQTTASSVRHAEVGVTAAQERLEQARAAARLVEAQVNSAIDQARTAVRSAETRLAEVRAGARDQERRQAEARVMQAKASLDLAEQTRNRYERLLEGGVISQQQFDQVKTEHELARQNYQQATEQLSLVEEGPRSEQVRLAELNVEQAKQQLAQAEANRTQIEVARQDVRAAEEGVRQAREQLNAALAGRGQVQVQERQVASARAGVDQAQAGERVAAVQLAKHVVTAPISGTVSARHVEPGEGASPGLPLLSIVSSEMLYVEASVSERDLARVDVGQAAEVRVDGLPDEVFVGEIITMAPSVAPESRTGTIRVRLLNPPDAVRPGMFARATIVIERREGAVVIARDALLIEDGTTYLFVVEGETATRREVQTGLQTATRVEVIAGLREGERVVIEGQDQLQDGDRVRIEDDPAPRSGVR